MARPRVGCCKPSSSHGAGRLHWFHGRDCLLLPGREIDPFDAKTTHPAGSNWDGEPHRPGCLCERHVYMELNLDRDDDITDVEVSEL